MLNSIHVRVVFDRKGTATRRLACHPVPGLVQISVNANGERRFFSSGVRIFKDEWAGGCVMGRADAQELNERIMHLQREVVRTVNECDSRGERFAFSLLDSLFYRRAGSSWTEWMRSDMEARGDLAPGTLKHHRKVLAWLEAQGVTDCSQLTADTVMRLDGALHRRRVAGRPMCQTSVYGYHKVLRCYIRRAVLAGVLSQDPYTHYRVGKGQSREREVLTMEEIGRLEALKAPNLYMLHVRDLFLMQVWTGLSVGDMMSLDFSAAVQGDVIRGTRGKTGVSYTTVLLPQARAILDRYGWRLPVMAYDDYRRMVQPVLQAAGIDRPGISTHNARHTFATTVALAHGTPMETVSRMLGHTSVKTTQIYARVLDSSVEREAEKLGSVLAVGAGIQ